MFRGFKMNGKFPDGDCFFMRDDWEFFSGDWFEAKGGCFLLRCV